MDKPSSFNIMIAMKHCTRTCPVLKKAWQKAIMLSRAKSSVMSANPAWQPARTCIMNFMLMGFIATRKPLKCRIQCLLTARYWLISRRKPSHFLPNCFKSKPKAYLRKITRQRRYHLHPFRHPDLIKAKPCLSFILA